MGEHQEQADSPYIGTFWQISTPERRVPGELTINDADNPSLVVNGRLFDERAWRVSSSGGTISHSSDPEDLVADWLPRDINGVLRDGTHVSIVDAQGGMDRSTFLPFRQRFQIRHVLMGEHTAGVGQQFAATRFRVDGFHNWPLPEESASTATGDELSVYNDDGGRWFEFTLAQPLTMWDIDLKLIGAITALTSLATANPATDYDLQVRVAGDGRWLTVHRERTDAGTGKRVLLDASRISAEQFAKWVTVRNGTDGLEDSLVDRLEGVAIQTQVLTQAAVAEGLHRRIFHEHRIPSLTNGETTKLRRAAREAALQAFDSLDRSRLGELTATDRDALEQALNETLKQVNEKTFRTRMRELADDAKESVPEIVSVFADWPGAVTYGRNILAHEGTEYEYTTADQFYDLLIALSYSLKWVLRTVLLRQAGFDSVVLRKAYNDFSAYKHHIANCRQLLAGGPYSAST